MELANLFGANDLVSRVRTAENADAAAIMRLLQRVPYSHVHIGWRLPVDWVGTPGFVVLPEPEFSTDQRRAVAAKLLGTPEVRLQACLAVAADPPPAAWVRVASVAAAKKPEMALAAMLARVTDYLRETAVSELGWLAIKTWPNKWLPNLGFVQVNEIVTYLKEDLLCPPLPTVPGLEIRPAQATDMATLAHLETMAFAPLWRHSADELAQARRQALCFDVALWDERLVGFQLSTRTEARAHLVRLTVHPELHGHGVGSALLARALATYEKHDYRRVSLNTQVDNITSQRLYQKFGFSPSNQRFPVWVLPLD